MLMPVSGRKILDQAFALYGKVLETREDLAVLKDMKTGIGHGAEYFGVELAVMVTASELTELMLGTPLLRKVMERALVMQKGRQLPCCEGCGRIMPLGEKEK